MTVATSTSKSGPYAGAGTTGPFTVTFRFLENSHLQVIKTSTAGIDSTLALTTDYAVSGAGASTGTVTLVSALLSGEKLTIIRNVPFTQEADYVQNDAFPAESHERALDKLTMETQQLKEAIDRSIKLPPTSTEDVAALTADLIRVADSADNIDTVADNIASVNANAAAIAAIQTNAANITDIQNASENAALVVSATAQAVDGEKDLFVAGVNYTKGTTTQLTLAYTPAKSGTVKVFFDGVFQHLTEWSLAGNVITFTAAISADKVEVLYNIPSQFVGLSNADLEVLGAAQIAAQVARVGAETAETNAELAQTNAENAAVLAESARVAAQTARDAAQLSAGVYASTAAGLAATTNGKYFSVVSGSTNEYLNLYLNSSGTAVLQKTYPSAASVDNWFRQSLGAFFYNPHYEFSGANLYFKPTEVSGFHFYVRGGYLPNAERTYQQLKDSLLAQTPSLDSSFAELGATSPSGVTDCILLKGFCALWYNPATNSFFAGNRNTKRQNEVLMIHNDGGRVGDCQEEAQIYARVENLFSTREAWKYECPIITSLNAPYYPNLDTVAGTLVIPADTLLMYRNSFVSIPATSINLLGIASTAKKVYYNTATSAFEVKAFSTALTATEQLNLVLVATIRYTGSNSGMTIGCTYLINGLIPGATLVDRSTQFAAVITPLTAVTSSTNYPNYNTSTRTFTLYQDTILSYGNTEWVLPSAQSVVVSASSANKVWWDTATNTLQTAIWSANLTDAQRATYVLVAAVRQSNVVPTVLSIMCPYTVNGDLFGQDFADGVVPNPLGAYVEGIHHRGFSGIAPENTIPAYVKAAEFLNSYVEGDIRWTSDDVAVLLHDDTIDRTSDGTGAISGMTLATAKTYDFGSWKGAEYTGTTIPTFEEVLKVLKKLSLYGYFEIKIEATVARVQQLLALLKKTGMQGNIEFDSFSYANLQKVVAEDPTQAVGYLGTLSSPFIASCVALKTGQNKVAAAVSSGSVTAALVEEAHQNGIKVVCWTVNTAADVPTLAALGVDGIMTDTLNVAALLRASEGL